MRILTGIFDRYLFRNLLLATAFVSVTLIVVIFLTQSLSFLELVIESGASGGAFWVLTFLAMPRFLENILPLSLMAATLFTYNRMNTDSELVAVKSTGASPVSLAKPALVLAGVVTVFLLLMTLWAAPKAISTLQQMRQMIKAQFSTLMFREGVFNQVGQGLTVYIRERGRDGTLHGLMIHDGRDDAALPSTIIAREGVISMTDKGYRVLVSDGSRQDFDPKTRTLRRLNFNRYSIELPDSDPVAQRWREPDERSLPDLLNPDLQNERDKESLRDFKVELHRRILSPFLAIVLTLMAVCALLIGPADRRGQTVRIALVVVGAVMIQGLYIAAYNLARQSDLGLVCMYALIGGPLLLSVLALSPLGERGMMYWHARGHGKRQVLA